MNEEKESRLRKMPKKPVKFEVPRDEQLKLAEEELKAAMMSFVRGDVHAMLFKDFKAHIQAMEHLETALAESPECVPGNLDLLLRWVVLRFCEQTPNTQSLLRVLDFTAEALGVAKDQGVRLTEQEGALFLPRSWTSAGIPWKPSGKSSARFCGSSPASIPRRACAATSSEASTPKIRRPGSRCWRSSRA